MSSLKSAQNGFTGTLVCFALKEEAVAFRKLANGKSGISILLTGIGKANAEKSLRQFLSGNSPGCVLTSGFAGGLSPELNLGDVVFATEDVKLAETISAAGARPAKFFCSSRIATTIGEKQTLRRDTGADAVEMESAMIHAVCGERHIPCATVRAISDTAHENMPLDFNLLANADLSLNYGKLAVAIAKSPRKISGLLRLQKNCRLAAENVAPVLDRVVARWE